jgi:hypothetical protein
VCAWDAKYDADLWRPVTGIRSGDADGNAATAADPSWAPLLVTPPFPSYVSGHSTFSAAAATVLADFYGTDRVRFTTVGEDTVPGVTRSFKSFSSAAAEAGQSRIYGGIHWQFDNQDGLAMGRSVGRYVVDRVLQRKRRGRGDAPEKVKAEPAPAEWRGATEAGAFLFSTTAIADAVLGGQE